MPCQRRITVHPCILRFCEHLGESNCFQTKAGYWVFSPNLTPRISRKMRRTPTPEEVLPCILRFCEHLGESNCFQTKAGYWVFSPNLTPRISRKMRRTPTPEEVRPC